MTEKTHFRKAFDSPYLSSADIVVSQVLTIKQVTLEPDRTKKTKDKFNTAWFKEKEIRPGEPLKPMILNATNSKTLAKLAGSKFIDDWQNLRITVYVDEHVRFGKETVEGLRISPMVPSKPELTPDKATQWANAKNAYKRDGNLNAVLAHVEMSEENKAALIAECQPEPQGAE
jgi:hypothetical protein